VKVSNVISSETMLEFFGLDGTGLHPEAAAWIERAKDFSQDKRDELAKKGHALPDGSFPIENKDDLRNALHAFGRAGDKAAAKAHIKKRAAALGADDMLPETW
jgi:hypothetical protein